MYKIFPPPSSVEMDVLYLHGFIKTLVAYHRSPWTILHDIIVFCLEQTVMSLHFQMLVFLKGSNQMLLRLEAVYVVEVIWEFREGRVI